MQVSGYYPTPQAAGLAPATPGVRPVPDPAPALADVYTQTIAPLTAGIAPGLTAARKIQEARSVVSTRGGVRTARVRLGASAGAGITAGVWSAFKASLLFKGLISVATNGYRVLNNQETAADGGTNVAGDLLSAAVGGLAAGLVSSVGTSLLVGLLGTGFMLGAAGAVLGAATFFISDNLLRQTSFYNNFKVSVHGYLAKAL